MDFKFKKAIFCVGLIFSQKIINSKVLISPLPEYNSISKKSFCFENTEEENSYYSDLTVSFSKRTAKNCYNNDKLNSDLSAIFHGFETFNASDMMGPLSISQDGSAITGNYSLNPSYSWENQNCKIEGNFTKNFDNFEISAKINVPFVTNKIVNNYVSTIIKKTEIVPDNKIYRNLEKNNKSRGDTPVIENETKTYLQDRYRKRLEDGVEVFAIRADYAFENFINTDSSHVDFKYLFFNKNLPSFNSDNTLTLDNLFSGKILVSTNNNVAVPMHLEKVISANGTNNNVATTSGGYLVINNDPFAEPIKNIPGALIPICSYQQKASTVPLINENDLDYDLTTRPDFVDDGNYGSSISLDDIYYFDSNVNKVSANPIREGSFLKIVATGKYDNGDYNFPEVKFENPPVLIQKTGGSFPSIYGLNVEMPNHKYSTTSNKQFDDYISTLTDVAILNEDGSFSNGSSNAVLWYGNNYSSLKENAANVEELQNLYFTTSLDSEGNPTLESQVFYDILDSGRIPDLTIEERVSNLEYTTYEDEKLANQNLYNTIQDTANSLQDYISFFSEQFGLSGALNGTVIPVQNRINRDSSNKQEKMQYSSFFQEGLGDVSAEIRFGKRFKEDEFFTALVAGLSLPTSANMNDSDCYFAVPLGNNGHTVIKLGLEALWNNENILKSTFFGKASFDFGLKNKERMIPGLINENPGKLINNGDPYTYPVIGVTPVKIDVNNYWTAFTGNLGGMFALNDYSGINLNYQFWYKWKDKITNLGSNKIESISYAATKIKDPSDSTGATYINLPTERIVTFDKTSDLSRRYSNTVAFSVFLNFNEDIHFDLGLSRVFSGRNVPKTSDYFFTVQVDF